MLYNLVPCACRLGSHASITTVANYAEARLAHKFISAVQADDVRALHKIASKKDFEVNAEY